MILHINSFRTDALWRFTAGDPRKRSWGLDLVVRFEKFLLPARQLPLKLYTQVIPNNQTKSHSKHQNISDLSQIQIIRRTNDGKWSRQYSHHWLILLAGPGTQLLGFLYLAISAKIILFSILGFYGVLGCSNLLPFHYPAFFQENQDAAINPSLPGGWRLLSCQMC